MNLWADIFLTLFSCTFKCICSSACTFYPVFLPLVIWTFSQPMNYSLKTTALIIPFWDSRGVTHAWHTVVDSLKCGQSWHGFSALSTELLSALSTMWGRPPWKPLSTLGTVSLSTCRSRFTESVRIRWIATEKLPFDISHQLALWSAVPEHAQ